MPVLATLKLPHRQKLVLVAMFGLGFSVCIISTVRLITFVDIQNGKNWDRTYTGARIQYWSTVEVNASIVCACVMTMKPLVQKLFPNFLAGSYVRGNHSLRWITPLAGTRVDDEMRNSTQPMALERTTTGASLKGGGAAAGDLEAQCRTGSVATDDDDDEVMCSVAGMSPLRAPPRAHLRLSIQATKSVRVVDKGGATEEEDDEKGSITEDDKGNRSSSPATSGWLSEAETVVVVGGKEWLDERDREGQEKKS